MPYIKLWLKAEGTNKRPRTMVLELIGETPQFYHGRKVNRFGEDNSFMRKDGVVVDLQELIDKALVTKTKALEMNRKHGWLVAKEEKSS
jgi:hypothetical protein